MITMKLHRLQLPLQHKFTIARGTTVEQQSLVVELQVDGISGYGEVTENEYYGHTCQSISDSLKLAEPLLQDYLHQPPETIWEPMKDALQGDLFALSALDMAAHDIHARRSGKSLWQTWGLTWDRVPESSYTLGIDHIDQMVAKLHEQPDWNIYKIKLGTDHDLEIVSQLRRYTNATFRVDANCSWSPQQTITNSKSLKGLGVEFIEQPLTADASDADKRTVFEQSALPIIADESCQTKADVGKCRDYFHGINVKICKCGGLTPAKEMLQQAREWGMKTMVGCMIESSIGISAAAHLLPLLDYADLDGAVLLSHDPAAGVQLENGRITMSRLPGTGAQLIEPTQR